MELHYDYWTGAFNTVLESLNRSLSQYIRHYSKVKIGITNNPVNRISGHKSGYVKWDFMVVKYKTTSTHYINKMEKHLIKNNYNCVENEIGGGGGPKGDGDQYLYVLLKK